jgi:hypothetical protein
MEVHGATLDVTGNADEQAAREVIDHHARRRRRVVVQRVHGEVGGTLADVEQDQ